MVGVVGGRGGINTTARIRDFIRYPCISYSTLKMRSGIDLELLEKNSRILADLVKLDARGGYFLQEDIEDVVRIHAQEQKNEFATYRETLPIMTEDGSILCYDKAITYASYALRTMLAHVRAKFANWKHLSSNARSAASELKAHPEWLREIYELISEPAVQEPPQPKRKHPLPAFRLSEDAEGDGCCH